MAQTTEHVVHYGDNKQISYLASGPLNGPLLIFIHGWPAVAETWKHQLNHFASLGFRVLTPDNPGYGNSTARKITSDYSLENLVTSMLAILHDTGRSKAVWIGHDWGSAIVSSLAAHHPTVCLAIANISVPYLSGELGLSHLVTTINRDIYPIDEYPNGPWDYWAYYSSNFDDVTAFMNAEIAGFARMMFASAPPADPSKPSFTSGITKAGGWFGGIEKPVPEQAIPAEGMLVDEDVWQALKAKLLKTSYWTANAYYINDALNRAYYFEKKVNNGVLDIPVLFVNTLHDTVCSIDISPKLGDLMKEHCRDLTIKPIEAGHWAQLEKPQEVNTVLEQWLDAKVGANGKGTD